MATLLEQGIEAVKQGEKLKGRELLTQVLRADNQSERAWLWLSEVVDTNDERIQCLEQVVYINPNNAAAQAALKKLKSLTLPLPPLVSSGQESSGRGTGQSASPGLLRSGGTAPVAPASPNPRQDNRERRPFRLTPKHLQQATQPADAPINHQPTVGMNVQSNLQSPGWSEQDLPPSLHSYPTQGQAQTTHQPHAPTVVLSAEKRQNVPAKTKASEETIMDLLESIPLLPLLIFGTLSVTAVGGLLMIVFLAIVN